MSDDLDLRGIDQRHEPDPQFCDALQRRIAAIVAGTDPSSVTETREVATVDLEASRAESGPRRRSRRVATGFVALVGAAAVVAAMVVISRDHTTAPADAPSPRPLEEPSRDEVAAASNAGVYVPGSGPTVVTATRSYVSLRRCAIVGLPRPCNGPEGWAYVTASVDGPGVHYGLLGIADDLVLSALDDRLFVASSASFSQARPSAPAAWLIDSVTGQRGPLTWEDEPTTLDSAEQVLVLFPAPNAIPWNTDSGERFLPRVVDRRDWTIRPLRVPEDATTALAIHQPGLGRIWIGAAPEGGDVGLTYSDDGGASWTDVELPPSLRPTSEELMSVVPGADQLLVVGATGNHVAVTKAWGGAALFVSADAGENWNPALLDRAGGNGAKLFVLSDDRLMLVESSDLQAVGLRVSGTPSDWSQLEEPGDSDEFLGGIRSAVDAYQHGLVVNYVLSGDVEPMVLFSTDLGHGAGTDWWTIPGLDFCVNIQC